MTAPRWISSVRPFGDYAEKYVDVGFKCPIPLPPKKKAPPPAGFTGHGSKHVDKAQLRDWLNTKQNGNIALRLWEVEVDGELWEVVGIDVDHHPEEVDDPKEGGLQLLSLERKYGKLLDTWTSSARSNGIAGIRFFLVPCGLDWRGDAAADIDVISKNYRFAVVFPSYHPNGEQYYWYPPGVKPDGLSALNEVEIPRPEELAKLPDAWIDFLTNGRIPTMEYPQDMDSTVKELLNWAKKNFAPKDEMCHVMQRQFDRWVMKLEDSNESHPIIQKAHYNLLLLGSKDGHRGWATACREFEKRWSADVLERGKRKSYEAQSEIARSREGALRKIKGQIENGDLKFALGDPCEKLDVRSGEGGEGGDEKLFRIDVCKAKNPEEYDRNDDGNARHFLDLFKGSVHFVPEGLERWIIWTGERWVVDVFGDLTRNMFRLVKKRQKERARELLIKAGNDRAKIKFAENLAAWASRSGNKSQVTNALIQAQSHNDMGVIVKYNELDSDPMVLGLSNGILRFNTKEARLKEGKGAVERVSVEESKELFITMNTGVPYIPMNKQKNHPERAIRESYRKFWEYMHKFIKDHIMEETWEYTPRLFGQCLLGHNQEKIVVFLVGEKNTTKSTFQKMWAAAIGDYGIWREPRILLNTHFKGSLAEALPRHVCFIDEMGKSTIHAELFKNITGNVPVSCELKNVNAPITMRARCTIISSCNRAPRVPDEDDATRERFVAFPFRHQVIGDEKDIRAQDDLTESCAVTMLAYLIEGCADAIMTGGIKPIPNELRIETEDFASSLSDVADFVKEHLVFAPKSDWDTYGLKTDDRSLDKPKWPNEKCTGEMAMWNMFNDWQKDNMAQKDLIGKRQFTVQLKDCGVVQDGSKMGNERRWLGVTLRYAGKLSIYK